MKNPITVLRANLSVKLIALFIGGGLLLASAIAALTEFGFERNFVNQIQPHFRHYIDQLADEIGSPPSIEKAKAITASRPIVIRIFNQEMRWASDGTAVRPQRMHWHEGYDSDHFEGQKRRKRFGGRRVFHDNGTLFILKQQADTDLFFGFKMRTGRLAWFPIIACLLVALGLYGFYRVTRWLFAPVRKIQEGVRLIGEGHVGHQIEVSRTDELGELAKRVNLMSTDLANMLKAKRDMLLALSHELKSPLARIRVTLALLEPSGLQENLLRDQQSIERLIDEVLESERVHQDHALLHLSPTDIEALIKLILKEDLIGLQIDQTVTGKPREVSVDTSQVRQLLRNLLNNAQRYNRSEKGKVQLVVEYLPNALTVTVSDFGEGIATQHLDRLTEAFYRADPSRAQDTGGLGLGLYLCKNIVQAHGGRIEIKSEVNLGTEVRVELPFN